jgi:Rod binding domain-containing protein
MDASPVNRSVRASELPLERLATSKELSQSEKIGEVSRQFEAVLLRQILGQAQKPLFKSSIIPGGGTTNAIYQDMITQQLADRISQGGTFGFAKVLQQQLTVEYGGKKAESADAKDSGRDTGLDAEKNIRRYKSPAIQPGKRI